jgi:hypothetical protein
MSRRRLQLSLAVLLLLPAGWGCDHHLETGYKFRALNASDDDRRGYYAPPFTPEANPDKKADKPGIMDQ